MMRVLFLSAPIGAGHIKAAQAIAKVLEVEDVSCQTEVANIFAFLPPLWGRLILGSYMKILALFPQAYGMMYGWGNESKAALWGRKYLSRFLARRLERYLEQWRPDMIVCTHATPAGLVADLVRRGRLRIPTLGVVTDFVVHRLWVYPELGGYVVAHEALRDYLLQHGVAKEKTVSLGIPVALEFGKSSKKDKDALLQGLGLETNAKTVLLMGGGEGLLPMAEIIEICSEDFPELQFIAVAGKNQKLKSKLEKMKNRFGKKLLVLGYTERVADLMTAADLLISKPGGLTVAESLSSGVPLLIYRPLPGQEEANSRYLQKQGVAFSARSFNELRACLAALFLKEESLQTAAKKALDLGRPSAASDVAKYIKEIIHIKNNEKC